MGDDHPSRRTFELLANEVRLRVITALGDASGAGGYATLAFSEIQRAAGVDDSSRLTYHLDELRDEFVEKTAEGYTLTLAGIRAYQAVIAHRSGPEVEVEPFDVDIPCGSCGDDLEAWYTDGRGNLGCHTCGDRTFRYPVDPSHIDPRAPETVLESLELRLRRDHNSMFHGLCPYCGGRAESTFDLASDHWADSGMRHQDLTVHTSCLECSWFFVTNVDAVLRTKEVVWAFCAERGVDWTSLLWTEDVDCTVESFQREPLRVRSHIDIEETDCRSFWTRTSTSSNEP
ncbi:ArsR/SmtB family transcription factor [Halobaculum litoreum]|uniref:ArsR/SmtB family transcription factor n=1 Tax=Halobaculum litoreum TaxID=3031998 RepID=A0ABD5XPY4_9EURY